MVKMKAHTSYINSCTGLSLSSAEVAPLLEKMTLTASLSSAGPDEILVEVPPTRPDILHECDIMEDAAIAYGFNKLPDTFPATNTVAQPLEMSKLTDVVRTTWAQAGFVEVLPLILVGGSFLLLCLHMLTAITYSAHTRKTLNG
jgi:phenylalanyl-tRNA synthetase beta chain